MEPSSLRHALVPVVLLNLLGEFGIRNDMFFDMLLNGLPDRDRWATPVEWMPERLLPISAGDEPFGFRCRHVWPHLEIALPFGRGLILTEGSMLTVSGPFALLGHAMTTALGCPLETYVDVGKYAPCSTILEVTSVGSESTPFMSISATCSRETWPPANAGIGSDRDPP